ncbi:hypothetical protein M2651_12495 [Clostridium sp. SYSU_GA19001]|uniref:TolB family protein n=1 Tax=Clostridium caldaquaticum TaxID=2940653 RepID=UPI002076F1CB|nr:hypothetical protein [Clostridium caldaquaticum]MCM8711831.1 hypothetical protein [Clostridium caldaquaticum]
MNKRFLKLSLAAVVLTYSAVVLSLNLHNIKSGVMNLKEKEVKASILTEKKQLPELVAEGTFFTPCLNYDGTKLLYSSGDDIYEMDLLKKDIKQLTTLGNCYNPVYFEKDNNLIAFARNDGIYLMNISKKITTKLVSSNNPQVSFAKPNFTPEGDVVYFKVTVQPSEDGHSFTEKEPSIYKISKDGKNEEKIIEGYNPLLIRSGKALVYESGDKIFLMDLESKNKKLIDSGKYASVSNCGNYLSYAKFERETEPYKKINGNKKLYIDKEYSNIVIANIENIEDKYNITKEEYDNREEEIKNWAKDLQETNTEQHFLVVSKIAYFDSFWSKDDSELYVSVYNGDKAGFELVKFKVDKK